MEITTPGGESSNTPTPDNTGQESAPPVPAEETPPGDIPSGVDGGLSANEGAAPLPGGASTQETPLVGADQQPLTPDVSGAGDPAPEGPVLTDPPKPDAPTGMPAVAPEASTPPLEETPQPVAPEIGPDTSGTGPINPDEHTPTSLEGAVGGSTEPALAIEPDSTAPPVPTTEPPATDASGDTPPAPVADKIDPTTPAGQGSAALEMTPEQHQALKPEAPRTERDAIVDQIAELHVERIGLVNQSDGINKKLGEIDKEIEKKLKQYRDTPEDQPAQTPESLGGKNG